ncbi:MAG: thiamine-phosphate kinase, partial [Microvirga sp.]
MTRPGEVDLIARYFAPIADPAGLGLKDDAACLAPTPGHDLVVTVDALVEGVHFLPGDPPGSVARKALGVNVSDLAAKGSEPRGFLLALALPDGWTTDWLSAFADGLGRAARDFGCPLLGGDTVRAAGPLTLSVTALGEVPRGRMVRRTNARPGDAICVTGTIGDAALGLDLRGSPAWAGALSAEHRAILADRYLHPRPRHGLAAIL